MVRINGILADEMISGENDQQEVVQQLHKASSVPRITSQKGNYPESRNVPDAEAVLLQKDLEVVNAGGERRRLLNIAMSLVSFPRNPQVDLQAQDRAHSIGQKKEVQVFRFCTQV
ncbi:hypothetical protein V6N13_050774 [Hibiscus sabdariffa]